MAIDIFDWVDPAELTGYVRAGLADIDRNRFTLSTYLPATPVNDIEYRFTRGGAGLIDAATFRTWDTEAPIGSRPGVVRVTGELPPISRKIRQGEYDRLRLRNATSEIVNAVFNDAENMMRSIAARLELARGQVLTTGKFTLAENGVTAEADYGRAAGHTVTAGTLWSNVGAATPITNLRAWVETYKATNGEAPSAILASRATINYLLLNAEVRNLVAGGSVPSLVSDQTLGQVLSVYGLPPLVEYDVQVNVAGVATRPIAVNKVVMVGGGSQLGSTLYGVTAEAQELDQIQGSAEAGIVAVATKDFDPVAVWTKAAAIAIPVLANPDLTFVATVA